MSREIKLDREQFHIKRIANSRDELLKRRDRLINQIQNVFHHVNREGGVSLREAAVIDDYGTDQERADARLLETDTHWSEVDVEELDPGGSCLSFIDPIGYRYYAPAYMIYTLSNAYGDALDEAVVDSNVFDHIVYSLNASRCSSQDAFEHHQKKFSLFTTKERTCIARFLAFDAECEIFDFITDSLEALKSGWIKSLPHSEVKHLRSIWPDL